MSIHLGGKSWQELLDKKLPEKKLLNKHNQLLNATRVNKYKFSISMELDEIKKIIRRIKGAKFIMVETGLKWQYCYFTTPDNSTQDSALDKGYKLRGSYHLDKSESKVNEKLEAALDRMAALLPDAEL